ncbi:MAG: methylated-DNA--[Lachnospiraceae bacterium]|nr:methylated-DNA--[protein]-cysteine S-methyltransferase [Lachnospiraceae bacterium]
MTEREEALEAALALPNTYTDIPFHDPNWILVRVKGSRKAFLWTYEKDGVMNATVKADPAWRDLYRQAYPAVTPAYHMNKEHWNNIALDGTIPDEDVIRMIQESYDLVTDSPSKRIYEAVKKVPKGKVATYGDIAALAGNPKMQRAVGNALHKNPDPGNIPCHRVVNSQGKLSGAFAFGGPDEQANRLRKEGVEVNGNTVDLLKYRMELPEDF